jgi:hypothetical protein
MGLLSEGQPLSWAETKKFAEHVRQHGISQFICQFHRLKKREGDNLLWGDEVEYCVLKKDPANRKIRVSLRAQDILHVLTKKERQAKPDDELLALWRPEYGAYMIEGTPGVPYGSLMAHFNIVEANMKARRIELAAFLEQNELLLSLTSFPRFVILTFVLIFTYFLPVPKLDLISEFSGWAVPISPTLHMCQTPNREFLGPSSSLMKSSLLVTQDSKL